MAWWSFGLLTWMLKSPATTISHLYRAMTSRHLSISAKNASFAWTDPADRQAARWQCWRTPWQRNTLTRTSLDETIVWWVSKPGSPTRWPRHRHGRSWIRLLMPAVHRDKHNPLRHSVVGLCCYWQRAKSMWLRRRCTFLNEVGDFCWLVADWLCIQ